MKDAFMLAINIEDKYADSYDVIDHDFLEMKREKFISSHDPPPILSSFYVIKEA